MMHSSRLLLFVLFMSVTSVGFSQYYYNDVVVLRQTNSQYQALKANHIVLVNAKSFDSDGTPVADFVLQQQLVNNGAEVITTSKDLSAGSSVSDAFYENGLLKKSIDTGGSYVTNTVLYDYDALGNITTLTTLTSDTFMNSHSKEVHQWFYSNGSPVRMLRIKDDKDTAVVDFVKDEQGNVAEEHLTKHGHGIETYFYYYNQQHQLTDIVRYNRATKKMLPDFLFDYDSNGRLAEYNQVLHGASTHLTWHYEYNANGLKQNETCYDKNKQLVGKIVYSYN